MSWNPVMAPDCRSAGSRDSIETLIIPRTRDIGGFQVRRSLPSARRQMVGPFIFFDQMGPAEFITEGGIYARLELARNQTLRQGRLTATTSRRSGPS